MPDFTVRHPGTGHTIVTGDPAERARLLAKGYRDALDEPATEPPVPSARPSTQDQA